MRSLREVWQGSTRSKDRGPSAQMSTARDHDRRGASGIDLEAFGNRSLVSLLRIGQLQRKPRVKPPSGVPSGGSPLDARTRHSMESKFRENFSDVRIHTGDDAARTAAGVQARAYTVGSDIVFGDGQFAPDTTDGTRLLAHELAHVLQQRQPAGSVAGEQDAERDARDAAHEVTAGGTATVRERSMRGAIQKAPLQDVPTGANATIGRGTTSTLDWDISAGGFDVVSVFDVPSGQTPNPQAWEDTDRNVLYVDPGVAGPSRKIGNGRWADVKITSGRPAQPAPPPPAPAPKPKRAPSPQPPTARKEPRPQVLPEVIISADEALEVEPPTVEPAKKPEEPPPPANAADLIDQYTRFRNLNEDALGEELLKRALAGDTATADAVLEGLHSTDRDDVSAAFTSHATADQLERLAETEEGRKLLLRLYDELTSGYVAEDEAQQAERVMMARARRIDPKKFIDAEDNAMVIPFSGIGMTKFSSASLSVSRLPNGKIWVRSHMRPEHWQNAKRLPSTAFATGLGREFDPDEVVGLYLYDEGGKTVYVPAFVLLQLSNQETSKAAVMMGEAVLLGLSLGAGSGVAAGGEAAAEGAASQGAKFWALRALKVADWAAAAGGTASVLIDDHRGLILKHFGKDGEDFLKQWSKVERVIAIYGLARGAMLLGQTALSLRASIRKWRAFQAELKNVNAEEAQALNQIVVQTEKTLDDLAQAQRLQGGRPGVDPPSDPSKPPMRLLSYDKASGDAVFAAVDPSTGRSAVARVNVRTGQGSVFGSGGDTGAIADFKLVRPRPALPAAPASPVPGAAEVVPPASGSAAFQPLPSSGGAPIEALPPGLTPLQLPGPPFTVSPPSSSIVPKPPPGMTAKEMREAATILRHRPNGKPLPEKAGAYDGTEGGVETYDYHVDDVKNGQEIIVISKTISGADAISLKEVDVPDAAHVAANVRDAIDKAYQGPSPPKRGWTPVPGTTDVYFKTTVKDPAKLTIIVSVPGPVTDEMRAAAQAAVTKDLKYLELPPIEVIVESMP